MSRATTTPSTSRGPDVGAAPRGEDSRALGLRRRWTSGMDRIWVWASVLVGAWLVVLTPLHIPPGFDEAVFISQSGPLYGNGAHPLELVASRERGTSALVGLVRLLARNDLPRIRLLWLAVHLAAVVLAFAVLARHVGRRAAIAGFVVFATGYVPMIFFGAIYGSLMGAAGALLATALYLRCRDDPPERWQPAVLLGAALALMFWFRNLESVLILGVLGLHALLWRPREVVARWRSVLIAGVTFAVLYAIPWTLQTGRMYGGIGAWFHSARTQPSSEGNTGHLIRLYNGLPQYGRMFVGHGGAYPPTPRPPGWVSFVAGAGMLLLLVLALLAVVTGLLAARRASLRSSDATVSRVGAARGLLAAQCVVSFGFYVFVSPPLRERYMLFGLIFLGALVGCALDDLAGRTGRLRLDVRRGVVLGAAVLSVLWLVSEAVIAHGAQNHRILKNDAEAETSAVISTLAHGHKCVLLGKISSAQHQLETGCKAGGGRGNPPRTRVRLGQLEGKNTSVFVMWFPGREHLKDALSGFPRIPEPGGVRGSVLSYRLAPAPNKG